MSLQNVIARMKTGTYAVSRETITFSDGFGIPGVPVTFTIDASVQPLPGAELSDNGEGKMVASKLELWTTYTAGLQIETTSTSPDVVTVDGVRYRVVTANHFGIRSNHWRCTLEKVDVP
jgi:hypothetical protein